MDGVSTLELDGRKKAQGSKPSLGMHQTEVLGERRVHCKGMLGKWRRKRKTKSLVPKR
jgi:hypothetical protein